MNRDVYRPYTQGKKSTLLGWGELKYVLILRSWEIINMIFSRINGDSQGWEKSTR